MNDDNGIITQLLHIIIFYASCNGIGKSLDFWICPYNVF